MFDALQIAATGLHAQQQHVDAIANNLANVNTVGFKRARVGFRELVTRGDDALAAAADVPAAAPAARLGAGVAVASVARSFDAGDLRRTEMPLDVAFAGEGFLEATASDGQPAFTRGGSLSVNADGLLATATGHALKPGIAVPADLRSLTIAPDGQVEGRRADGGTPLPLGRLDVARFHDPGALAALGDGLYRATEASGEPIAGRAGEDGLGTLRQGFLEGSNVRLVDEVVGLMVAQRAYEASAKVVQACDEMAAMVNNLRR
ncbi:MAG TPA: flagellar basal-body rod protein FlgG [Albitalea sp.]